MSEEGKIFTTLFISQSQGGLQKVRVKFICVFGSFAYPGVGGWENAQG